VTIAVEASEAMRRIVWRHRWMLIAFTLVPVAIVVPLLLLQPTAYMATARVQTQAAVPDAETQVLGIVGRVTAIGTSQAVVESAIAAAGVDRNAAEVARRQVTVTAVGSSGVVTLAVTDRDPQVALRLASALATAVVDDVNTASVGSSSQLAALQSQQSQLTQSRDGLIAELAQAQADRQQASDAGVQALITQLAGVETQLANNAAAVQQLLASDSAKQEAAVLSTSPVATAVSRSAMAYAALAGLLGLVLGLLVATVRELVSPTVAQPSAGARELGLVLLGTARLVKDDLPELDDDLVTRMDLAAERLGARTLVLTGPMSPDQLGALAARMNAALVEGSAAELVAGSRTASISVVRRPGPVVMTMSDTALRAHPEDPALVLVLSAFAPRSALDRVVDLSVTTGWPILGVVGVRRKDGRRREGVAALPSDDAGPDGVRPGGVDGPPAERPQVNAQPANGQPANGQQPKSRTLVIADLQVANGKSAAGSSGKSVPGAGQAAKGVADRTGGKP
jgi:capsular polysaccharide biosynthesis protein